MALQGYTREAQRKCGAFSVAEGGHAFRCTAVRSIA